MERTRGRFVQSQDVTSSASHTLPGWWVERTDRGGVHVVNPKEIPKIFPKASAAIPVHAHPHSALEAQHSKFAKAHSLSPEQIQRIAHQIEQKCRNLEV